jgi:hypothetical protein
MTPIESERPLSAVRRALGERLLALITEVDAGVFACRGALGSPETERIEVPGPVPLDVPVPVSEPTTPSAPKPPDPVELPA